MQACLKTLYWEQLSLYVMTASVIIYIVTSTWPLELRSAIRDIETSQPTCPEKVDPCCHANLVTQCAYFCKFSILYVRHPRRSENASVNFTAARNSRTLLWIPDWPAAWQFHEPIYFAWKRLDHFYRLAFF